MDKEDVKAPLNGLDLNLLITLRALLLEESVSRAATFLGTTQPTVSRGLASLRDAFEDPLLVRTGRGMVLTPVAKSLISPLDQALAVLERLKRVSEFDPASAKRQFRIVMPDILGCGVVGPLRNALVNCSGVGFDLLGAEGDAVGELLSGRSELVVGATKLDHADFYSKVLPLAIPWSVVLGPQHPRWNGKLSYSAWLKSEHAQLIPAGRPDNRSELERTLELRSETRKVRMRVAYLSGLGEALESTAMVTTLPTPVALWLATRHELKVVPHPFKELSTLDLRLTWHAVHQQDAGHRWFRELVGKYLTVFLG